MLRERASEPGKQKVIVSISWTISILHSSYVECMQWSKSCPKVHISVEFSHHLSFWVSRLAREVSTGEGLWAAPMLQIKWAP